MFNLVTLQTKASLNKQRYRKDLTKAAMRRAAAIVRLVLGRHRNNTKRDVLLHIETVS